MIKLTAITLPSLPVLGSLGVVTLADPNARMRGWHISIRGPAVCLVSPPGWALNRPLESLDKTGPRRVFELPRAMCVLQWETNDPDEVDKLQRYDSPAMGVAEEPDLEALTAPGGKVKK